MDVTVDWLLFGEDDPKVVVRDRLLLQRFVAAQDLAPEDRRVVLDLLDALMLNAGKDPRREIG
jgi:hypothetical protein